MNDNLVLDEASKDKDERGVVVKFDLLLDDRSVHRWSESLSENCTCSAWSLQTSRCHAVFHVSIDHANRGTWQHQHVLGNIEKKLTPLSKPWRISVKRVNVGAVLTSSAMILRG